VGVDTRRHRLSGSHKLNIGTQSSSFFCCPLISTHRSPHI
jgi:hypothetical protein